MGIDRVKALVFDVFGTVVDWRGSVTREGRKLGEAKGISHVDWTEFTNAWRAGYRPSMARVRSGELPWIKIDVLHRMVLDEPLYRFVVTGLSEEEKWDFNFAWHRLDPWPDSMPGLTQMKQRYTIAALSNGNVNLFTNMTKWAGLPWDSILSAEVFKHYKPDPETYLGAAEILGLEPSEVMMLAAHKGDLNSAREGGLKPAFVPRPGEHGPNHPIDTSPEDWIDVTGFSFEALAKRLGV